MAIGAGELDERITLRTRTRAIDNTYGGDTAGWDENDTYAKVIEAPGREFIKGEVTAEGRAVFLIRKREGLDSTAEVRWPPVTGRIYGIQDITRADRDGLMLHCIAHKADEN